MQVCTPLSLAPSWVTLSKSLPWSLAPSQHWQEKHCFGLSREPSTVPAPQAPPLICGFAMDKKPLRAPEANGPSAPPASLAHVPHPPSASELRRHRPGPTHRTRHRGLRAEVRVSWPSLWGCWPSPPLLITGKMGLKPDPSLPIASLGTSLLLPHAAAAGVLILEGALGD